MEYKLRIEGLKDFKRDIEKAAREVDPLLKKAMVKSTALVKGTAKGIVIDKKIQNTGSLRRSIHDRIVMTGRLKGIVNVGERYGLFVEVGTRPHWPPVAPLEKWARLKLGKKGIGYLIARKISRQGTKAQPFLMPALKRNLGKIEGIFDGVMKRIVKRMAGK